MSYGPTMFAGAGAVAWIERPTMMLRFVDRGGRSILQQQWEIEEMHQEPQKPTIRPEWRDVPLAPPPSNLGDRE